MSGIEMIEAKSLRGHVVKDGCLQLGMPIVSSLFPSVIVSHKENDVRGLGIQEGRAEDNEERKYDGYKGSVEGHMAAEHGWD